VSAFCAGSSLDLLAQTKSDFEVDLNSSENPFQEFALKGPQQQRRAPPCEQESAHAQVSPERAKAPQANIVVNP